MFLLYSYEFINVGELSLLSLLFHINVAFIAAFLIMSKVELKERILFLEALLEMNTVGLEKAIETNRLLIDYLRKNNVNSVQ